MQLVFPSIDDLVAAHASALKAAREKSTAAAKRWLDAGPTQGAPAARGPSALVAIRLRQPLPTNG